MDCPHCNIPLVGTNICPKCKYDVMKPDGGPDHLNWLLKKEEERIQAEKDAFDFRTLSPEEMDELTGLAADFVTCAECDNEFDTRYGYAYNKKTDKYYCLDCAKKKLNDGKNENENSSILSIAILFILFFIAAYNILMGNSQYALLAGAAGIVPIITIGKADVATTRLKSLYEIHEPARDAMKKKKDKKVIRKEKHVAYKCPNCGGINSIEPGSETECEFCGSPITIKK